jgi:hypothetical protein
MSDDPPAMEVPTPPPPQAPARMAAPSRGETAPINGAEGLTQLCHILRDEATLSFPGNAVEQARAYEAHAQRRQAALAGRYMTIVPSAGFAFRNYDLGERRLLLDTNRSLVLDEGAELFMQSQEAPPSFTLGPDLADRLLAQQAQGRAALQLLFRPAGSQLRKDACVWLGGGRVVKLEIELVAAALLGEDGTVVARANTGEYADASVGNAVRSPKVSVHKPRGGDGRDLAGSLVSALAVLAQKAQPCYERVLTVRPALRGTLVLGIRVGSGGRIEEAHVEMSSLGDDTLTACVARAAAKTTVNGASAGQRISVPLQFSSADD